MAVNLWVGNDLTLELDALKLQPDDTFVNDATVTATVLDKDGNAVTGQSFPATLSYVAASNGTYRATLEDGLNITAGERYTIQVTADAGSDVIGYWEEVVFAKTRTF